MTAQEFLIEKGILSMAEQRGVHLIQKWLDEYASQFKIKAEKWDKLDDEIGKYYENDTDDDEENEDEEFEGSLLDIGETAAIAFGYL